VSGIREVVLVLTRIMCDSSYQYCNKYGAVLVSPAHTGFGGQFRNFVKKWPAQKKVLRTKMLSKYENNYENTSEAGRKFKSTPYIFK